MSLVKKYHRRILKEKAVLGLYYRPTLKYFADLIELWGETGRRWETDKAKIEALVRFIPRKFRINRLIFKKENQQKILKAMQQAQEEGFWVGVRSCYIYQPLGKAPWIMAMKSKRALRFFFEKRVIKPPAEKLTQKPFWLGTPAHYNEWCKDPGLKEIIVMFNPPLLCPRYKRKHFVARIECFEEEVRLEMRLYTDQTRDIEADTKRKHLITITAPLNYKLYLAKKMPLIASFGRAYFKKDILPNEKRKKAITTAMFDGKFGDFKLKNHQYEKLIKPHALEISSQVAKIIFNQWLYPPLNLYYRLQALREFGLSTLEVQGRMKKNKIAWMLVYGLRGAREVAKNLQSIV